MAYERPKKGTKFARVDTFDESIENPTPRQSGVSNDFFEGFDNIHSGKFAASSFGGGRANRLESKTIKSSQLESLVTRLAELHFTVKGKVDDEGKVELMFCSPEPVVVQEPAMAQIAAPSVSFAPEAKPEIRYIKERHHRHDRSRDRRGRKALF